MSNIGKQPIDIPEGVNVKLLNPEYDGENL